MNVFSRFEPRPQGYIKRAHPLDDMGRSILEVAVSTLQDGRGDSEKQILLHFGLRLFGPTHVLPYPEFSSADVGWPSYADRGRN